MYNLKLKNEVFAFYYQLKVLFSFIVSKLFFIILNLYPFKSNLLADFYDNSCIISPLKAGSQSNLYFLFKKTNIEILYDENYVFFLESINPKSFIFQKNLADLVGLYKLFKTKRKLVNPSLFTYFFVNKQDTFLFFIKAGIYYKFCITNTWDFKNLYREEVLTYGTDSYFEKQDDFYFMSNYLNSWKKLYNVGFKNTNNRVLKFINKKTIIKYPLAFYKFFKNFILAILISIFILFYTFFFFKLTLFKTVANWLIIGLLFFWLFSTFNFFIKRYRFSKYTSAIQRFWKRAFMCFWLIEGLLFTIFFYYLLNASGEPAFMFDTFGYYVNHLLPIKMFLTNSFLIVLIINIIVFLLINIKFISFKKNVIWLFICTNILIYILFVESYQFYYILNFYVDYIWVFSEEDNVWELDYDIPRTRNKNHYITLIIVAKFWHYIFIFISWVFFLMKTIELKRIRYTFLSMNLQNMILFYIMNWLCLYSWFKWVFRRFMNQSYYWFYTTLRTTTLSIVFNDVRFLFKNMLNLEFFKLKTYFNFNFYYLSENFYIFGQASYFKNSVLNAIFSLN